MPLYSVWIRETVVKETRHLISIDCDGERVRGVYDTIDQVNVVGKETELLGAEQLRKYGWEKDD